MFTHIIEAMNNEQNWGKFMVMTPSHEWERFPATPGCDKGVPLLEARKWTTNHIIVFDLETGEGAQFDVRHEAQAQLQKHKVWVCPLFEPFLMWLLAQFTKDKSVLDVLSTLPPYVNLDIKELKLMGYRRPGPDQRAVPLEKVVNVFKALKEDLKDGLVPRKVLAEMILNTLGHTTDDALRDVVRSMVDQIPRTV